MRMDGNAALGIFFGIGGTLLATGGTLVSMRLQRLHQPIIETTAWGMGYGALVAAITATLGGVTWSYDPRLGYIDVYLLHNPEYFLDDISHRRPVQAADHDEFYRRVREAFRYLESQVAAGKIRWYGVSSNHYPLAGSEATHTSVARTLAAAEEVSRNHHFRVVQLPLNLYESGGALEA